MAVTLLMTGYYRHPKLLAANTLTGGELAEVLWVRGLDYVNEHGSDGYVPAGMPLMLTPTKTTARVKALVHVGLWLVVEGGWAFHDFLEWNRPADELEARRAAISQKRSSAGKAGAASRWNGRISPDVKGKEVTGR